MKFLANVFKLNVRSQKGWSLTELMVGMAVFGLTSTAITQVYVNGQKSFIYLQGSTKNMQVARSGIDVLAREIRSTIMITSAGDNNLTFTGDFNGNGVINTITYEYNSSTSKIMRTLDGKTTELGKGVINESSQPIFKFYDQFSNQITSAVLYDQAKMIEITLYVDDDPNQVPNRPIQVSTSIQLRNLHERR